LSFQNVISLSGAKVTYIYLNVNTQNNISLKKFSGFENGIFQSAYTLIGIEIFESVNRKYIARQSTVRRWKGSATKGRMHFEIEISESVLLPF
jgi:hypothetical protein